MKNIKWITAVVALILLGWMGYYSYTGHDAYSPSVTSFLKEPEKYHGELTAQTGKMEELEKEYFMLRADEKVKVMYDNARRTKYGLTEVLGLFHKEGYIDGRDIHYHDYSDSKYYMSAIGGIWFLFIFLKEWKFKKGTFRRKNA